MVPNMNEDSAPHDGGANPSPQFERNPSGLNADYSDRGHFGSSRSQMERESYDRRFMRGERSASMERVPMQMKEERPYGPPIGFYGGPRPYPRDMPMSYGRDRMYGYGGMGRGDYGWPGRPVYGMDFGRFSPEGRRDFGAYNRGYGEPFCPPYGPEQWGYGDRYRGGYDRSRRGDYYGMGSASRRGYSCAPTGSRYGSPGPLQPGQQSRQGYPRC